jgi:hypothetical protein
VPRSRWADALARFSRSHRGWLASAVTVGPGPELTSQTGWHPLETVTLTQAGGRPTAVRVAFQGGPDVHIGGPRALALDRTLDGAERALEIDAAGGVFVRVVLRATALPEEVDGMAAAELVERRRRRIRAA